MPLNSYAFSGIIMHNVTFNQYHLNNNTQSIVYTIKAKKSCEKIPETTSDFIFTIYNKEQAKKQFYYSIGTISINNNTNLSFNFGYYYQGKFIMNNVNGIINDNYIYSQELIFNLSNKQLLAKQIVLTKKHEFISKMNYSYFLP